MYWKVIFRWAGYFKILEQMYLVCWFIEMVPENAAATGIFSLVNSNNNDNNNNNNKNNNNNNNNSYFYYY